MDETSPKTNPGTGVRPFPPPIPFLVTAVVLLPIGLESIGSQLLQPGPSFAEGVRVGQSFEVPSDQPTRMTIVSTPPALGGGILTPGEAHVFDDRVVVTFLGSDPTHGVLVRLSSRDMPFFDGTTAFIDPHQRNPHGVLRDWPSPGSAAASYEAEDLARQASARSKAASLAEAARAIESRSVVR